MSLSIDVGSPNLSTIGFGSVGVCERGEFQDLFVGGDCAHHLWVFVDIVGHRSHLPIGASTGVCPNSEGDIFILNQITFLISSIHLSFMRGVHSAKRS